MLGLIPALVDVPTAPVPLAAELKEGDAVVMPTTALVPAEAEVVTATAVDVLLGEPPAGLVIEGAVEEVDAGAAEVEVEAGAAEVAVAAHEQTEATAVMTWMPVTGPQADSTQPWAEAWMAAEEEHWQL